MRMIYAFARAFGSVPGELTSSGVRSVTRICRRARGTRIARVEMASSSASRVSKEPFRLSPSDFAFQWEECSRCFYLKSHGTLYRPRMPFPSIFNKIDMQMKMFFRGRRTESLFPNAGEDHQIPKGEFLCEEDDAAVQSMPITNTAPGAAALYIFGKIDCLIRLDDGTYAVIDFKTSQVDKYIGKYSRQLHAYAHALENPSDASELDRLTISRMGLIVYEPQDFDAKSALNSANLRGSLSYVDIPRDEASFRDFLGEVGTLLASGVPKKPKRQGKWGGCSFCNYLEDSSKLDS